ncbi:MAG TPA: hypothetical protein ENK55_07610 [Actinobacteria bacterium]|nr:hypothetical protein [Actinomycetota bacterium]
MTEPQEDVPPLRERFPDYVAFFGIGLVAATAVGIGIGLVFSATVPEGVGYTIIMLGVVLLLAGGATGGGYTNLGMGALEALFAAGGREEGRPDPMERLRRGLRPEANPRAFWQVVGGICYVAVGLAIVVVFGD